MPVPDLLSEIVVHHPDGENAMRALLARFRIDAQIAVFGAVSVLGMMFLIGTRW